MASMSRALSLCLALLAAGALPAQVPLPPAAQVLKPLASKVVDAILKPKMKVDHFTVGGFTVTDVDPTSDATAEKFEGTGLLQMPAPGHPTKITFKNLVLKGAAAEGTVEADFPADHHATVQGWLFELKKAVVSDKGAHLEGRATLAGIRLNVAPVPFTPAGLQGSVNPGDLPLAEGNFIATLKGAEVVFSPNAAPQLKGTVKVEIEAPVRHAATGELVTLESGPVSFSSTLLGNLGSGVAVDNLATDLPLLHKGSTWRMDKVFLFFERGTPSLAGPTRLQFHLNVFCRVGATDQPYVTDPAPGAIHGTIPKPGSAAMARVRGVIHRAADFFVGFEGFSGSFPLPAATLHPSGLTAYRLQVDGGTAVVKKGVVEPDDTRISGKLTFGHDFSSEVSFKDAPAALSDGLYLSTGSLTSLPKVGAYLIQPWKGASVVDFSPSRSPEGLDADWEGVFVPGFAVLLPGALYTVTPLFNDRVLVALPGTGGRFEANGEFSGSVVASFQPKDHLLLHIVPVTLEPFQLDFVDGVLLKGPIVKGQMDLKAPSLIKELVAPISFHLTQNGVEQVEVDAAGKVVETNLIGVDTVLDRAVLNPTNIDFTGRFDFHVTGADLPSIAFDHLVFEATGGGINGVAGPLKIGLTGQRWDNLSDHPKVNLWGFPFALSESGFGVTDDNRYFVGFGGQMDVNPFVPSKYNRVRFTTEPGHPENGTVDVEHGFDLNQDMGGLGSLNVGLDFKVETAGDQVSTAYFKGTGDLAMNLGDHSFTMTAGARFGRQMKGDGSSFPYFYALGHFTAPDAGVAVAPDVEIYGLMGGLAHNFQPGDIADTEHIEGQPNEALGYAISAGVDAGSIDQYTFHGNLDLYIAQNLTTLLQGKAYLFCSRNATDNEVSANIAFTRNPNMLDATFAADIAQGGGMLRYVGNVAMHFGPDKTFIHIGSKEAPIKAILSGIAEGNGYLMADFANGNSVISAGMGFHLDTGEKSFGPLYGRAWLNAHGDLILELDASHHASIRGTASADGGAEFGMKFKTFWHTYHITIFSGDLSMAMSAQIPGDPRLSGVVTIHYSVLGGAFDGNVSAHVSF